VSSVSGAKYFMTFIDDYTWHCTVKFLKQKNEASAKVQEYIAYLEQQQNILPKCIRADNGKEYVNNDLIGWCYNKGLQLEFTAPHSLEQNGVAEHYNRTLADLVRAMLIAQHLPKSLWAAAAYHTAYLRNHTFTRAIEGATPLGKWTGIKPTVRHLYEFGAPIWVLNEGTAMSKLDPRSTQSIFIGFADGPHAIKYYDI
jgi:transposase InsO family protein